EQGERVTVGARGGDQRRAEKGGAAEDEDLLGLGRRRGAGATATEGHGGSAGGDRGRKRAKRGAEEVSSHGETERTLQEAAAAGHADKTPLGRGSSFALVDDLA